MTSPSSPHSNGASASDSPSAPSSEPSSADSSSDASATTRASPESRINDAVRKAAPLRASDQATVRADAAHEAATAGSHSQRRAAFQAIALYYVYGLVQELQKKDLFLWAQAIAFKVLISVVPIFILAIGLLGRVLRGDASFDAVARIIRELVPEGQEDQIIALIHQLQDASGAVIGIGGVGLFLSVFSLFITLRIAVRNAFAQDWHTGRSLIQGYLFDIRMIVQVGLLFLATILLSFIATTQISGATLTAWGLDASWLHQLLRMGAGLLAWTLPLFITMAMFFHLYYFVPMPHPRKRSALIGAALAAVLWEITKYAFTYYATYVGRFERYINPDESLFALGNTFGLLVAFVFWVYFSGIILMIGAVVASLHEHRHVMSGRAHPRSSAHMPEPAD